MLTPARHLVHQRSMLVSFGNVAVDSLVDRFGRTQPGAAFAAA